MSGWHDFERILDGESFMAAHDDPELMDVEQRADLSLGSRYVPRHRGEGRAKRRWRR